MSSENKLTVLGHLQELRGRITKSAIAVLVATAISFIFANQIFEVLKWPAQGIDLIFIEMTEMIGTYMKVCLAAGIVLAMPYIVYQFLMYVSPALSRKERKYIYFVLPWVALMFIGGVLFGYFVLVPPATNFLISFGSEIATPQIKIGNYISIVTRLLLAIGFVFELPVITTFLARLGIITPKWLADKRKTAIIFAFILAAIITPTFDPLNQILVAAPLVVLYEMSIWLAKIVQRKQPETTSPTPAS
jgi:sec-independent protein translocase protein TatC